jgi:hypothetical protein
LHLQPIPEPSILVVSLAVPVGHLFVHTPGRLADMVVSKIYPTAQVPQFVEFKVQVKQLELQLAQVHVAVSANCVVKQLELLTQAPESR